MKGLDGMKKAYEDFCEMAKAFRHGRALKYEKKYNDLHNWERRNTDFIALSCEIEKVLGKDGISLLNRYTDSVIALYNTDADYYYNCGFDDRSQLCSELCGCAHGCCFECGGGDDDDDGNELLATLSKIMGGVAESAAAPAL
jgi:hypothetical protein